MLKKQPRKLPDFDKMSLEEIAEFWDTHDSADYWDQMEDVTDEVIVRRPTAIVSIRIPEGYLKQIKRLARDQGLGHTTLIRMWIREKLKKQPVRQQ